MRHNLRGEFNASKPKPIPKPKPAAPHDPWDFYNPPANLGVVPVPPPPLEEPENLKSIPLFQDNQKDDKYNHVIN